MLSMSSMSDDTGLFISVCWLSGSGYVSCRLELTRKSTSTSSSSASSQSAGTSRADDARMAALAGSSGRDMSEARARGLQPVYEERNTENPSSQATIRKGTKNV